MNLNQLEYFVCAAEKLNFTRAAAQCFISQTAMTQQIRALEETVGVPLFIRDKHHVELTPAGAVYLKEARRILAHSDEAMLLARLAAEGDEGDLTVGYITGFGQSDCPEILDRFHKAYPNIQIKLLRNTMGGLIASLEKGECDLAFTLTPGQFHNPVQGMVHRYLMSYPLMAVLPKGHSLEARDMITYPDLEKEKFIIMQPSSRSRDKMEELMLIYDRGGFMPDIEAFCEEPETILLMVSVGLGICLMPEYIVRHHRENQNLVILPVVRQDGRAETLDFEMVWRENCYNPAVRKMLNCWKVKA